MEEPIKKERYFSQKEKKEKERLRSSNQKRTKRTIKGVLFSSSNGCSGVSPRYSGCMIIFLLYFSDK